MKIPVPVTVPAGDLVSNHDVTTVMMEFTFESGLQFHYHFSENLQINRLEIISELLQKLLQNYYRITTKLLQNYSKRLARDGVVR